MRTPKILVVGSFVMDLIVSTLKCTQDVRTMGTVKNSNCPKSWVHFIQNKINPLKALISLRFQRILPTRFVL